MLQSGRAIILVKPEREYNHLKMTKGRVQWDEANIVEIESNKPVRQKITEPKTPYHPPYHPMIDDDGSLSSRVRSFDNFVEMHRAEELKNDLNDLASSSKIISHRSDSGEWSSSEDEADPVDQHEEDCEGGKNTSFNEHRRVHYDEFRMVKEMRSSGSFYGEDAEVDDGAKTGKPEATISQNTPGSVEAISSGKSSSSST
ncbi:phosphoprotein phosphatase inhibitor [Raphanus sativus]|nr:phosphoprotein phosphatase inhibitor [Raphanus sativus]